MVGLKVHGNLRKKGLIDLSPPMQLRNENEYFHDLVVFIRRFFNVSTNSELFMFTVNNRI